MDNQDFDELAGRIEALARAVLLLAQMMERETDMDGPSLSHQWRQAAAPSTDEGSSHTVHKTLQQLAQALDDARSRHQELVSAARLANARHSRQAPSDL